MKMIIINFSWNPHLLLVEIMKKEAILNMLFRKPGMTLFAETKNQFVEVLQMFNKITSSPALLSLLMIVFGEVTASFIFYSRTGRKSISAVREDF